MVHRWTERQCRTFVGKIRCEKDVQLKCSTGRLEAHRILLIDSYLHYTGLELVRLVTTFLLVSLIKFLLIVKYFQCIDLLLPQITAGTRHYSAVFNLIYFEGGGSPEIAFIVFLGDGWNCLYLFTRPDESETIWIKNDS